jgi:hypothetical protein
LQLRRNAFAMRPSVINGGHDGGASHTHRWLQVRVVFPASPFFRRIVASAFVPKVASRRRMVLPS